jgi:speckle-type POZ protein
MKPDLSAKVHFKEASEKKVEIKDFDASVVEAMLRFMYSFDYSNVCGTSSMVYDAHVYQIADKYDIPALKTLSMGKFGAAITTGWSMDDFSLAIGEVYDSTPSKDRGLRDLAVETSCKNIDKLLQHDGFCKLLRRTPDFAADLIPVLCGRHSTNLHRYECPSCEHTFRAEYSGGNYHCPSCSRRRSDWDSYHI